MTLKMERSAAVIAANAFLRDLIDRTATPKVPAAIRQRALNILRHFPTPNDIRRAAEGHSVFGRSFEDEEADGWSHKKTRAALNDL